MRQKLIKCVNIKTYLKTKGYLVSKEFLLGLEKHVEKTIEKSIERMKYYNRVKLKEIDLPT